MVVSHVLADLQRRDLGAARDACRHALAIHRANEHALALLGTVELLDRKPANALAAFEKIRGYDRFRSIVIAEHWLGRAPKNPGRPSMRKSLRLLHVMPMASLRHTPGGRDR
jgi:hypothetical protein